MTSKYDPLREYLAGREATEVPMSFEEIERVIGRPLPAKSVNHPAWWSNNPSNNTMTKVWLDAGYRTERVNIGARRLVFRRQDQKTARQLDEAPAPFDPAPPRSRELGLLERLQVVLSGTVRVTPGVDLTAPTGARWEAEAS